MFRDINFGIVRILRREEYSTISSYEAFDGQFTIQSSDDDLVMPGSFRAVYDEQVSVMDASPCHGVSVSTEEKGGCPITHQMLMQIQPSIEIILSRRRESGLYRRKIERLTFARWRIVGSAYNFQVCGFFHNKGTSFG